MASQAVAADSFTVLIDAATDDDLRGRLVQIQETLERRKVERQEAAQRRAIAILREAGLDIKEIPMPKARKRGRKAKK